MVSGRDTAGNVSASRHEIDTHRVVHHTWLRPCTLSVQIDGGSREHHQQNDEGRSQRHAGSLLGYQRLDKMRRSPGKNVTNVADRV
jgi:hypothetical protein